MIYIELKTIKKEINKFLKVDAAAINAMKITDVNATWIWMPLEKPFHGGTYTISSRGTIVTRIFTDDGIIGEAFAGDHRTNGKEICILIEGELKKAIVGEDLFCIDKLWSKMFTTTIMAGNKRLQLGAISLVDMALWDAVGKAVKQPLYKILGGYKNKIPIITIGGYYQEGKTLKDFAKEIVSYRERQMAGVKFKVGRVNVEEDVERVKVAREAAGDDFVIAVDANKAWTPEQAIKFARLAEKYDIAWLEEPVHWYNFYRDMKIVRDAVDIPLTAGQSELTRFDCRDLMEAGVIDICNVDSSICGGITEWMKIADLASMYRVSMAHHEEWQIAMHLFGAIPHGTYAECFVDTLRDPLFENFVLNKKIKKGFIEIPSEPGLGLELNEDIIKKYQVK